METRPFGLIVYLKGSSLLTELNSSACIEKKRKKSKTEKKSSFSCSIPWFWNGIYLSKIANWRPQFRWCTVWILLYFLSPPEFTCKYFDTVRETKGYLPNRTTSIHVISKNMLCGRIKEIRAELCRGKGEFDYIIEVWCWT